MTYTTNSSIELLEKYESIQVWNTVHFTIIIVMVLILSPLITICSGLVICAVYRFKRLQTPSNYYVTCLASADLGIGLFLPFAVYFELTTHEIHGAVLCFLPYSVLLILCSVSMLCVTAIAVDRALSLAFPLHYKNIVTHNSVGKNVMFFWIYSLLIGSSPVIYELYIGPGHYDFVICSFQLLDAYIIQFLFFMLYFPCALVNIFCYVYIYIVARYHARAIFSVEMSLRHNLNRRNPQTRYGITVSITIGTFLILWLPFQVCMLTDVYTGSHLLNRWSTTYLSLMVLGNSAANPWIYAYHSSEFRYSLTRMVRSLLGCVQMPSTQRSSMGDGYSIYASHAPLINSSTTHLLKATYLTHKGIVECSAVIPEENIEMGNIDKSTPRKHFLERCKLTQTKHV